MGDMGMKTNITISIDTKLKEEMDRKIEKGKQSSFIAECVRKALKRKKVRK